MSEIKLKKFKKYLNKLSRFCSPSNVRLEHCREKALFLTPYPHHLSHKNPDDTLCFGWMGQHLEQQHYYHARYPTDDWHLAYVFSLVYFSVYVCLVGVLPHSVSTRRVPCVRVCAPLTMDSCLQNPTLSTLRWRLKIVAKYQGVSKCWQYGSECLNGLLPILLLRLQVSYVLPLQCLLMIDT